MINMNERGFTLIELLAVIVILAIIALIATPVILGIIDDSRKGAQKTSVINYANAIDFAISREMLNNNSFKITDGIYNVNSDGNICLNEDCSNFLILDLDGESPNKGMVSIVGNKAVSLSNLQYESFYGSYKNEQAIISDSICYLSNDIEDTNFGNTVGTIGIGDEITCGTESFYVMPEDSTAHGTINNSITLLAKYNLNVGDKKATGPILIQNELSFGIKFQFDETTNKYKDNTIGCTFDDWHVRDDIYRNTEDISLINEFNEKNRCNSTVAFDEGNFDSYESGSTLKDVNSYWNQKNDKDFVYNSNASISEYVENYGIILKDVGIDVKHSSLPSYKQIEYLNCSLETHCPENLDWIYLTTYWTGSYSDSEYGDNIYYLASNNFFYNSPFYDKTFIGVRPIIIIPKSDIGTS